MQEMAPKPPVTKVSAVAAAAFDDDASFMAPPVIPVRAAKRLGRGEMPSRDETAKRPRETPRVASASAAVATSSKGKTSAAENVSAVPKGKSSFRRTNIKLDQRMVDGQLLGFGRLILSSKPRDYEDIRFYTGSSSSGESDSLKEDSYRLARSLGVASDAEMACGINYKDIGLLSPNTPACSKFMSICGKSFQAPEVERDLLRDADRSSLVDATELHLFSVSACNSISSC